jgi:putative salt-induced outer membrane protein YdiY
MRQCIPRVVFIYYCLLVSGFLFSYAGFAVASIDTPLKLDKPLQGKIVLKNGDVITGSIIAHNNSGVQLQTTYGISGVIPYTQITTFDQREKQQVTKHSANMLQQHYQQNALSVKEKLDKEWAFKGAVDFSVNMEDGNIEKESYDLDTKTEFSKGRNRLSSIVDVKYTKTNNIKTKDEIDLSAQYDYFIDDTKTWYIGPNISYINDEFKAIDRQLSLGFGTGYQIIDTKDEKLRAELGLAHVYEEDTNGDEDEYFSIRWYVNYFRTLFAGKLTTYHTQEGLFPFESPSNLAIDTETGIRMPVSENMNIFIEADIEWDSDPQDNKEKTDTAYKVGVGFNW